MIIAVGTKSKQKISYLKEVLCELNLSPTILFVEAKSKVSDQPLSLKETTTGALNRAKAAMDHSTNCDFAIGIEFGYKKNLKKNYEGVCVCAIVDKKKKVVYKSHFLPLPTYHDQILKKGIFLGDNLDSFEKKKKESNKNSLNKNIRKKLADIIRKRDTLIKTAIYHALLVYLNREEFY